MFKSNKGKGDDKRQNIAKFDDFSYETKCKKNAILWEILRFEGQITYRDTTWNSIEILVKMNIYA